MPDNDRKPLFFVYCEKDYKRLPEEVQADAGYNLERIQYGKTPEISFDSLHNLGSGVRELRIDENTDTYRVVYVAKLSEGVFVLDAFKKKSPRGSQIPNNIKDRIQDRYGAAKDVNSEMREDDE